MMWKEAVVACHVTLSQYLSAGPEESHKNVI